jgi:deoxycytidine triphosphate deaminase
MLSDVDILEKIESGDLKIENFADHCLTPVGYDLRIGKHGWSIADEIKRVNIEERECIAIQPHQTALIKTYESIGLSKKLSATINSKVTRVISEGFADISTTVDPGWEGDLLVKMHNESSRTLHLCYQEPFCTICFYEMKTEAKRNHGHPPERSDITRQLEKLAREVQERKKRERRPWHDPKVAFLGAAFTVLLLLGASVLVYRHFRPSEGISSLIQASSGLVALFISVLLLWRAIIGNARGL